MPPRSMLLINKFYHDVGPAGGVGRYLVQEEEDLRAAGWDVIPFAMADADARPSPWDEFFVRARDYKRPRFDAGSLGDAVSLIWNREAARNLERLIRRTQPAVAHLHNIYHHLSPSILQVLVRHRIPVVMTLHDLRLLCPAIHMLRQGEICERCRGGRFYQAVLGRCVKDSAPASLLAAIETFHQRSRGLYTEGVTRFLCPSRFILEKYSEWGFPRHKLEYLPNFVDLEQWQTQDSGEETTADSYLYFGRLSREKGVHTLLEAHAAWEAGFAGGTIEAPPLKLLIAGTGPDHDKLRSQAVDLGLNAVEFLGHLATEGLQQAMTRSRFSVLPSECYENCPMSALESLAAGLPLVGADVGGVPELIEDGINGVIVPHRNVQGLLEGILRAMNLGPAARNHSRVWAEQHASRREHMARLEGIIDSIIA